MPSTVPHFGCLEFGIYDKGIRSSITTWNFSVRIKLIPDKYIQRSPKQIYYPGPIIRIKGFPA